MVCVRVAQIADSEQAVQAVQEPRHAARASPPLHLPFAPLLYGMVSARLGFETIYSYLGIAREALYPALGHLDLPVPHDRPLRAPGPRGWSAADSACLIAWRLAGVHPADIGMRLGRSVNAVRARCRRLGVPTPARSALRRQEPSSLVPPCPGFFARGVDPWIGIGPPHVAPQDQNATILAFRPRPLTEPEAGAESNPDALDCSNRVDVAASIAIPASALLAASVAKPQASEASRSSQTPKALPEPAQPAGDLAWVKQHRRWRKCHAVIEALAIAYFGGQHHQKIAERAGVSVAKLQSFLHRVELPRDRHRSRFSEEPNDALGRQRLEQSGYRLAECAVTGNLFFRHARDVGIRMCRKVRFAQGKLDDWDRYRSQEVSFA